MTDLWNLLMTLNPVEWLLFRLLATAAAIPVMILFLDKHDWANSVDPDQTASEGESDQGLHCLPFHLYTLDI